MLNLDQEHVTLSDNYPARSQGISSGSSFKVSTLHSFMIVAGLRKFFNNFLSVK